MVGICVILIAIGVYVKIKGAIKVWMNANEAKVADLVLKGTCAFIVLQTIMLITDNRR